MTLQERIDAFLAGTPHAVVGASRDRAKYGNKVLRAYLQNDREVYPVNPNSEEVEGLATFPDLASLPQPVRGISVITKPDVTERIVEQAAELGIKHIWMQPGAESEKAVKRAEQLEMNVIAGGPCALVTLRYHEDDPVRIVEPGD
ncbi:MAG: CoA-binding protein [Planctomycetes bacterium]|nr:CoA-binding protein [Planctomycetota bacterium]